jgi:hypothetical protein
MRIFSLQYENHKVSTKVLFHIKKLRIHATIHETQGFKKMYLPVITNRAIFIAQCTPIKICFC